MPTTISCRGAAAQTFTHVATSATRPAATAAATQAISSAAALALLTGTLWAGSAQATTLYDPGLNSLPSAQGWTVLAAGAPATQLVAAGSYKLDTTGTNVSAFGNGILSPVALNTATGFDLRFSLGIASEAHTSSNRSGYSVLFVGADPTQSLELAFWSGNVWAYNYDASQADPFVHGLDAAFDTSGVHSYQLSVVSQQYTLRADGNLLLSGSLHNYTAFGVPYTQPNFLFLGDDSSRGVSVSRLGLVSVTAVPEPASALLLLLGLGVGVGVAGVSAARGAAGPGRRWPRR